MLVSATNEMQSFGNEEHQERLIGKDEGIQGISCPVPPARKIKRCWIKKLLVVQRVKVRKMVCYLYQVAPDPLIL
jgi:hypothetical protein